VLYDEQGRVKGVATGNLGVGKDGEPHDGFQIGMELLGKYTVFAEGARGHLGKQLLARFKLTEGRDTQTYAIGIKELWEIPADKAQPGKVVHTAGWPMLDDSFGGGFLYHLEDNKVTLGFVIGLDYQNPHMSPFEEMQRWKTHPAIRAHLEGGKRIGYGARAINNGTPQALPKLIFPGGALVGCDAGFLNAARIKGSHAAIKSGMLVAEAIAPALAAGRAQDELADYPKAFEASWLHEELQQTRNFKLWFKKGGKTVGQLMTGIEQWLLPKLGVQSPPWTLHNHKADHEALRPIAECAPITYPKPDGKISFDRLSSVFISNTNHEENQPAHLTLKNADVPQTVNLAKYGGPESRYCPAGVYEFVEGQLVINAQKLRALQDLRHQGPDAEHRLGHARGRRRAELRGHVTRARSQSRSLNIRQASTAVSSTSRPTTMAKPCRASANGTPPTFMPNMPATMFTGSASTVTEVSTNSVRLLISATCAAISSCSSLMRSCRAADVAQRHREFLAGLTQLLHVELVDPGGRMLQQAEQRARLGRQQALQAHQHAAQLAQTHAPGLQPAGQQLILDVVDAHRGLAHHFDQHVGLIAHQVREQIHRAAEALPVLHRAAQAVDRAQRLAAAGQQQARRGEQPERRGVAGVRTRNQS
jgi:flavin-dependent dehydrogenase